jgi:hypothetical protein
MAYDYIGPYSPEFYTQADQYYMPDNYEPPWLTLAREGIRRGAETAQIVASGYPSYPSYPTPTPQPAPMPAPAPGPGLQPTPAPAQSSGITLSPMTLMLLVGGFLLFTLGKSKGR